jgi:hypothetical protein
MIFSWGKWVWLWLGTAAGIVIAGFGVRLLWRGIADDVWKDSFGDPIIRRWVYVTAGILCIVAGGALVAFLVWQWRSATA